MEASQMAVVKRIEEVIDTAYGSMMDLHHDLTEINKKLLPVPQVAVGREEKAKSLPSGWFEEILDKVTSLRAKIQATRFDEARRLKAAVAAGKVKRAE